MAKYRRDNDPNMYPCRNGCGARVYWRDGQYCPTCRTYPERHCFSCDRMSQTLGSQCLQCDAPLGRLQFGFDRLSDYTPYGRTSENQRVSGWSNRDNTAYGLFEGGTHEGARGGITVIKDKVKAPGSAWPTLARQSALQNAAYTRWIKGAASEVRWRSCFACGEAFTAGDAGWHDEKLRGRIVTGEPGKYWYDSTQKAHRDCPRTEDEQAALDAATYASRASYLYELAQKAAEATKVALSPDAPFGSVTRAIELSSVSLRETYGR